MGDKCGKFGWQCIATNEPQLHFAGTSHVCNACIMYTNTVMVNLGQSFMIQIGDGSNGLLQRQFNLRK